MGDPITNYDEQPVTFEDDPYGAALDAIVKALDQAEANAGGMSEGEYNILQNIRAVIAEEDPAKVPHWNIPVRA